MQVLLYPNQALVGAVMGVIEVVLSKNDPSTVRAAVASGLVYLLFLGTAAALLLLYCCFTAAFTAVDREWRDIYLLFLGLTCILEPYEILNSALKRK